ncbi:apolipoprotein C-I [Mastacembelus armatus]|uniref:Apolipoprotein C-I n=1 Tax=Mastacembelus armatus TaxID=205130 RepID=A0A7N8X0E1_9TELE|nr:apolipoprotein C-I-like [Mastacembelus armatus]
MRLYLAVAMLMLAFVAFTEAQEETIKQRVVKISEQLSEGVKTLADKAKTGFDQLHNSDFAVSTRNWFQEQFDKVKTKLGELTQ